MPLVSRARLVNSIRNALPLNVTSHNTRTRGYDLYELYLFGLCVEAARAVGFTVDFVDSEGRPANSLIFRTSPSSLRTTTQNFTHAELWKDGILRLELHLGVYVAGQSGVSHEADVVILEAAEAARARSTGVDPRVAEACIAFEAKYYANEVGIGIGREFLGLSIEFGSRKATLVTSASGPRVHKVLSRHKRSSHYEVLPGSPEAVRVRSLVETSLSDYLARTS